MKASKRRTAAFVAAAVCAAGGVSACGNSTSKSTSSGPASSSATTTPGTASSSASTTPASAAPTGAPIVIGNVGTYSGPDGVSYAATQPLLTTWAKSVNASGGINGHPVKVISDDDAGSTSKALTDVENLVNNDHAVALVGVETPLTTQAYLPFVTSKHIPVIGGELATPGWFTSPYFFAEGSSFTVLDYATALTAKDKAIKRFAEWPNTSAASLAVSGPVAADAKSLGVSVVDPQTIVKSQTSYSAECLSAQSAKVQAISVVADPATVAQVITSCNNSGYHPLYIHEGTELGSAMLGVPGGYQGVGVISYFPWFVTSGSPALDAWGKAIGPVPVADRGDAAAGAWIGMQMLQQAAKVGIPAGATPSSAEILKGLWSFRGFTAGGLTGPITFHQNKPASQGNCWFDVAISGGKFSGLNGNKAQCATPGAIPGA